MMASLGNSTIKIELNEEDRRLLKKIISLLEKLNEGGNLKSLAKQLLDQHNESFD